MNSRLVTVAFAMIALAPSTARCELFDIGLFNGTDRRLQLLIDYSSGRHIDWALAPRESILMRRGFGEHITRVSVSGGQQTYDVDALRRSSFGRRHDLWLYFSRGHIRVITNDERRSLEHPDKRPNQAMQRTADPSLCLDLRACEH
jgi:hypothetical protein